MVYKVDYFSGDQHQYLIINTFWSICMLQQQFTNFSVLFIFIYIYFLAAVYSNHES